MSFSALSESAARWAAHLGDPDRPVVIHLAKSAAYYELAAAAFLHGRSFCPVDLRNPVARVDAIVGQLDGALVVTDQPDRATALRSLGHEVLPVEAPPALAPGATVAVGADPHYWISTSGTTGTPKLVAVAHDATVKFVDWSVPYYEVDPHTRWAQFSSIGFDLSIVDLLTALAGGATLVGVSTLAETARLNRFVTQHAITHWHSVPSVIGYLLRGAAPASLRMLSFCGEPLLRAQCVDLRRALPAARIVNTYGPTEGPLFCTAYEATDDDLADTELTTMPLGTPIPGWSLAFVDDDQGSRIVLLGEQLADGYHGRDDPAFGRVRLAGADLQSFDTGDYVRRHRHHLVFSHRRDRMVKVGGIRLDLGDVADACLRTGLDDVVVLLHDDQLVACYEGVDGERRPLDADERPQRVDRLGELLPDYAVPARFVHVVTAPRNANGKIDRTALADWLADGTLN